MGNKDTNFHGNGDRVGIADLSLVEAVTFELNLEGQIGFQ